MFEKCKECGTTLPCIGLNDLCKECDEQFIYCFTKCENICRRKNEQKEFYDKWKPGWDQVEEAYK